MPWDGTKLLEHHIPWESSHGAAPGNDPCGNPGAHSCKGRVGKSAGSGSSWPRVSGINSFYSGFLAWFGTRLLPQAIPERIQALIQNPHHPTNTFSTSSNHPTPSRAKTHRKRTTQAWTGRFLASGKRPLQSPGKLHHPVSWRSSSQTATAITPGTKPGQARVTKTRGQGVWGAQRMPRRGWEFCIPFSFSLSPSLHGAAHPQTVKTIPPGIKPGQATALESHRRG